jgi:hypothetical protein
MAAWENLDFSPLASLPHIYRKTQQDAKRDQTLASLAPGSNLNDVALQLFKAGDIQGGTSLATLANANAQQAATQAHQTGMLDVARQNIQPEAVKAAIAAGYKPGSEEFKRAVTPKVAEQPISITEKKMIADAENEVPRLQGTIRDIETALKLNPGVHTGAGPMLRARIGNALPDALVPDQFASKKSSADTLEWNQIMSQEAIQRMGESMKGATTEGEMKRWLDIAADATLPVDKRKNAMERFLTLAKDEIAIKDRRVNQMRTPGAYWKPGGGSSAPPDPRAAIEEARAAIAKGAPRDKIIERLKSMGIQGGL